MSNQLSENIFAEERKSIIVDIVNKNAKITVTELCDQFSVSPATIRNDLRDLQKTGLLKRTHGGAISNKRANFEPNSYQKEVERINEKLAIAQIAEAYVDEGDTIALDTGTTTFELAKLLVNYEKLTVVTNDLQIAVFLENNSKADIIFAGGCIRRGFHCTIGQTAVDSISHLNVDRTFLAANGISIDCGITTPNIDMARFKEKIVKIAREVILLADSTKVDTISFVRHAELSQVDVLITDDEADPEYIAKIKDTGVIVEICNLKGKRKSN